VVETWGEIPVSSWSSYMGRQNNGFKAYSSIECPAYISTPWMSNMINKYGSFASTNMTENIIQKPGNGGGRTYLALDENVDITTLQVMMEIKNTNSYPITAQNISTLRGANTIYSNSNDVTEITYFKHGDDAYTHIPVSNALSSNDNFILVTDDGYVIGDSNDYIVY
jgi:hypothetical protein